MDRLKKVLQTELDKLSSEGRRKGVEQIITKVLPPSGSLGPRYLLKGRGEQPYIRMNSNSYLGLGMHPALLKAEEEGSQKFGVGPGAVRFISGTQDPHRKLEKRLAAFHGREEAMIFSSAYTTVGGVLSSLISKDSVVISDELNHNSIINGIKLAKPLAKTVYAHNNLEELKKRLDEAVVSGAKRCVVVTDGVFSMRGDYAPLKELVDLVHSYDQSFEENAFVVMDDSHGVGAYGQTGRGTEEITGAKVDVLIGTLGKAFGVNGGYVCSCETVVTYLREHAPMYIYSNPISAGEASALLAAIDILESDQGAKILEHLRQMTQRFEQGLIDLGFETISGPHPVTPLVTRDTDLTRKLVSFLHEKGVLATGMTFPVVPRGDEEIRFQINADHTQGDIDQVLGVLKEFKAQH